MAPRRTDNARARAAKPRERSWRPTKEVKAWVAWSIPRGRGDVGSGWVESGAASAGPPERTRNWTMRWSSGALRRFLG